MTFFLVMLTGSLSGMASWSVIYPIDIVKTQLQTLPVKRKKTFLFRNEKKLTSALHIAKQTYRKGGVRAFWRGLFPSMVRTCVVNAVFFPIYEGMKAITS